VTPQQAYAELIRLAREQTVLASCADLLEWDEETSMPRGGGEHRAGQLALLAGLIHDRSSDPHYGELLALVADSSVVADPQSPASVNVRQLQRTYDRERRKPRPLVVESARVTAHASQAWAEARARSDFKSFAPWLDHVFTLAREEADALGSTSTRYDALLEEYEPGMTAARVAALFRGLQAELKPLGAQLRDAPAPVPAHVLRRDFPVDRQRVFAEEVAATVGFDLERGRIDLATHPFCMAIGPGDIRIALRFHPRNFAEGILVLLHELGHALFDQGLEPEHYGTPMGEAPSLGVHESQSRLWENLVGRSNGFWQYFYPRLRSLFHESLHDIPLATFRSIVNRVQPGPVRSRADELTYDLHILIRFELEQALVAGDLRVADLPAAWSDAYERHLGVRPRNDREGCLQDGHWSEGLIGYFPTYTLGNIYAAQLFDAAERALGSLDEAFARGDFGTLLQWLNHEVHQHGQRYSSAELIERVTGKPPEPSALIDSLRRRYPS
jgi:carboxypeptidase Taq